MWVIKIGCGSPGTSRPSAPPQCFLGKLIVLVTASRLWLGVTYKLPWGSVECSSTPPMDPSGTWDKAGQALG